ncbi:PTS sugar transporter subunit IIB [Yersinia intermedia]|jgi:PTS system cellobiose-specific IIB component|uniref:PTS sugar transporter subunit IIB n=3 Tax=root TaxID=1 RepID=A0A0T9ML14_YERIN|nr:PTS sugar transporter subunit IIB [Yersinia intermedia]AXV45727.1 PTS system cellobiose-specific EIIB component [uncultured organism]MCB5312755.1 PTS sugar transporter subunit IIB [Yersinia intermedia]MCB5323227.1 PTS sugar transporter subunit IIB [Yersinia intermedia]MCB5326642.1 PTS sugar transporter subunit IIB [Yersinia intermedia]MDA5493559.1 PTS sugar transporter subunit IIB [Yersinia intermedia]
MKKILLVCAAGMSTSMLVKRMQDHASSIGLEVDIEALSISDAKDKVDSIDIVMLGPQVRYQKAEVEEIVNGRIPVLVINMKDYGSMNGKAVLETALAAIQ